MRKADHLALAREELPIKGGKQPALHFRGVIKLVAFAGPDQKRLLHQVARVASVSRQTQSKPMQWRIVQPDQFFKIQIAAHSAACE
jgi:hypothetical protein